MLGHRSILMWVLLVCGSLSGCRGDYALKASVQGSVVSDQSAEPIIGAKVAFGDSLAETGPDGVFAIDALEPGEHPYEAEAAGYTKKRGTMTLRPGVNAVRFVLAPMTGARITGHVLDRTTREGVVGACVALAGIEMQTGIGGTVEFEGVPPGRHELAATAEGYEAWWQVMEIPLAEVSVPIRLTRLGLNGRIIFSAIVNGRRDVYIMRADGDERRAVTATGAGNYRPALSPDGHSVLFAYEKDGIRRIWRANVDGSSAMPLTSGPSDDYPAWSPTGDRFAYQAARDGANRVLVSDLRGLTLSDLGLGRFPAWSPDGTRIIFIYSGQLNIAPSAGGDRQRIGPNSGVYYPAWSPTGSRIAFSMKDGVDAYGLYLLDLATSAAERVAIGKTHLRSAFSPDGRIIAYHTIGPDSATTQIYVTPTTPDGSQLWVSRGGGECQDPCWR